MPDLGDGVPLQHEVRDPFTRDLTAATVTLSVTAPSGAVSSPAVTSPSTGIYRAVVPTTEVGPREYTWTVTGTVVDKAEGGFLVTAGEDRLYASVADLREWLGIKSADGSRDQLLIRALSAASRKIDDMCTTKGPFWAQRVATTRTIRPGRGVVMTLGDGSSLVRTPPISTLTGLTVLAGSVAITDFTPYPDDALTDLKPFTGLRRGLAWFGGGSWFDASLTITAKWGWPAVPDQVAEACLISASRLYKRKDSPEGVLGSADWGVVRVGRLDPDVLDMLANYMDLGVA
jgi:hypothetical protein